MKKVKSGVAPKDRLRVLEEGRRRKMARSAHAYVRGNTVQFYEWLHARRRDTLPARPAHLDLRRLPRRQPRPRRQRPTATSRSQIRDLDQTVIGNPAHDLIRLGLSLAMAARGSDLPGVTTALMIEQHDRRLLKTRSSPAHARPNSDRAKSAPSNP